MNAEIKEKLLQISRLYLLKSKELEKESILQRKIAGQYRKASEQNDMKGISLFAGKILRIMLKKEAEVAYRSGADVATLERKSKKRVRLLHSAKQGDD